MDGETREKILTPQHNGLSVFDDHFEYKCSGRGEVGECSSRLHVPGTYTNQQRRDAFQINGWIHLGSENFCPNHATSALAAKINLLSASTK